MFPTADAVLARKHLAEMEPFLYDPVSDKLVLPYQSFVARTPRHTVLIDTCTGEDKGYPAPMDFPKQPWLDGFRAAGLRFEDIGYVFCTHLHIDHCGWNTQLKNVKWVPTFPNAKYLFSRLEHERWKPVPGNEARAELYNDSVLPVIESKQAVMLEGTHQIDDLFTIEPAAGHTIGHVMMRAESRNNCGFFCGDVIHHAIQVYEPEWNTKYCEDPVQAVHSSIRTWRRLERAAAAIDPDALARAQATGDGVAALDAVAEVLTWD